MKMISNNFIRTIVLFCPLSFLLFSCAGSRAFPPDLPSKNSINVSNEISKLRAQEFFIKARGYDLQKKHKMAIGLYEMSNELDPGHKALEDLLIVGYLREGSYEKTLSLFQAIDLAGTLSDKHRRIESLIYAQLTEYGKAASVLEGLHEFTADDYCVLGSYYERLDRKTISLSSYKNCYEMNPLYKTGMKIGALLLYLNRYSEADSLYVQLDSLYSKNRPQILNALGVSHLIRGDTASAADLFRTVLILDSTNSMALENLASILIKIKDYDKAIEYYKRIIPGKNITARQRKKALALLYYNANKNDSAKTIIMDLLSEDTQDLELHFYLGQIFKEGKQFDLAELQFKKILAISKNYNEAWRQLCFLYLEKDDIKKALNTAKEYTHQQPENGDSWRLYGYFLSGSRNYSKAVEVYKKALNFMPSNVNILFDIAAAMERTGDYKGAENYFLKVLAIDPKNVATANYLGYMWADQNINIEKATKLIEIALKDSPENAAFLDSYGWVLFRKGEFEQAKQYIIRSMKNMYDDPVVYEHLAEILYAQGKIDEAVDAFKKSIELGSEVKGKLLEKIMQIKESKE